MKPNKKWKEHTKMERKSQKSGTKMEMKFRGYKI